MPYQRYMGQDRPGLFVLLVDSTYRMNQTSTASESRRWREYFGHGSERNPFAVLLHSIAYTSENESSTKAQVVATCVNRFVRELGSMSLGKHQCDFALIGYDSPAGASSLWRGSLAGRGIVSISEIISNPLGTTEKEEQKVDPEMGVILVRRRFDHWLNPTVGTGVPGAGAAQAGFAKAHTVVEEWLQDKKHQYSFPPFVVHISGGGDVTPGEEAAIITEARKIEGLATEDGNTLVFTIYLPDVPVQFPAFPVNETELPPGDHAARRLFAASSVLPDALRTNGDVSHLLQQGCRMMI